MRNRQMIVHWLMAKTNAIEVRAREGKTYYVMTRVAAFREGVGRLLAEVQRIKARETTRPPARWSKHTASTSIRLGVMKSSRGSTDCSCRHTPDL